MGAAQSSKCVNAPAPLIPPPPPHQAPAEEQYSKNTVRVLEKPNRSEEEEEIGLPDETLRVVSLIYEPADGDFVSQVIWVDENGRKCCMLYARSLKITWSEDPRYWRWFPLQETSNIRIQVAALLNVCWLEIHGRLEMSRLTPATTYEAAFVVMMSHTSYGWNDGSAPVKLRLTAPPPAVASADHHRQLGDVDMQKCEETVSLTDKPRGQWIELRVGEFRTSRAPAAGGGGGGGEDQVEISLFELEGGAWKNGLVVKGIRLRPKK